MNHTTHRPPPPLQTRLESAADLDAALHDALVKVAGPLLDEQTELRAQIGAHRLLLTLLLADRFDGRRAHFDALMTRLIEKTEDALQTLPGGPRTPEALAAQARVQMLLMQFKDRVGSSMAATPVKSTHSTHRR